jgi:23S rRNA A2030 N6-methylase RlmJ
MGRLAMGRRPRKTAEKARSDEILQSYRGNRKLLERLIRDADARLQLAEPESSEWRQLNRTICHLSGVLVQVLKGTSRTLHDDVMQPARGLHLKRSSGIDPALARDMRKKLKAVGCDPSSTLGENVILLPSPGGDPDE